MRRGTPGGAGVGPVCSKPVPCSSSSPLRSSEKDHQCACLNDVLLESPLSSYYATISWDISTTLRLIAVRCHVAVQEVCHSGMRVD